MNIDIDMNNSRKGDRHKKDAEGNRINKASLNLTKKGVYSTYINSLSPTSKQLFVDNKRKTNRERYRTKKLEKQNVELSNQLDNFRSSSSSSSSIDSINNTEQQKQQRNKIYEFMINSKMSEEDKAQKKQEVEMISPVTLQKTCSELLEAESIVKNQLNTNSQHRMRNLCRIA